jgi:hypothetical protein
MRERAERMASLRARISRNQPHPDFQKTAKARMVVV